MTSQMGLRTNITEQIVEALRKGTPPWRRPWCVDRRNMGHPANTVSAKSYRGINVLLLALTGYESKWWATYLQWQALGGQVRRGQRGTQIVYWRQIKRKRANEHGDESVETFPFLKTWTVFNVAQVEGQLVDKYRAGTTVAESPTFIDYGPAESVISATGADIRFGGSKAVYYPQQDYIELPPKHSFPEGHEYYATAFHELCHWTGHEKRLARINKNARFGDQVYAFEELCAEIGGCFLCTELGVPQSNDLSNEHAYLQRWLRVLEDDPKAIFRASTQASEAADFVLSFSRKVTDSANEEVVAGVAG